METKETNRTNRKTTPETKESSEKREFYGNELLSKGAILLSAMLSSANSAEISQAAGEAVLEAAGSVGNSSLLRTIEAESALRDRIGAVSDILGSEGENSVPEWAENVPENVFSAEAPFSEAGVPEFVFTGSAVDFSAAESLAQEFAQ